MRIAIYPGTFDPITFGHMDIIRRALGIVDRLVIGVAADSVKTPLFRLEERVKMVQKDVQALVQKGADVRVEGFEGLLVNFAKEHGANILIRGLRAVSDFEYEFQMAGMNSKLEPSVQTVFLPASESTHFIASRFVKEVARLGGDISGLVSEDVAKQLVKIRHKMG
jgi:pantetheine-phosphate adenylyltransferase